MKPGQDTGGGGIGGSGGGGCAGGMYGVFTPELIGAHPLMVTSAMACGPVGAQIPYISMGLKGGFVGFGVNGAFRYESQGPSAWNRSPKRNVLLAPSLTSANRTLRCPVEGSA